MILGMCTRVLPYTASSFSEAHAQVLEPGTPPPVTATLHFVDANNEEVGTTAIGDELLLVATSQQAGPHNMMLVDCTATRVGGKGDAVPFKVIDNG